VAVPLRDLELCSGQTESNRPTTTTFLLSSLARDDVGGVRHRKEMSRKTWLRALTFGILLNWHWADQKTYLPGVSPKLTSEGMGRDGSKLMITDEGGAGGSKIQILSWRQFWTAPILIWSEGSKTPSSTCQLRTGVAGWKLSPLGYGSDKFYLDCTVHVAHNTHELCSRNISFRCRKPGDLIFTL